MRGWASSVHPVNDIAHFNKGRNDVSLSDWTLLWLGIFFYFFFSF